MALVKLVCCPCTFIITQLLQFWSKLFLIAYTRHEMSFAEPIFKLLVCAGTFVVQVFLRIKFMRC